MDELVVKIFNKEGDDRMTLHEMKEKFLAYDLVWFMVFVGFGWLILYLLYMIFAVIVL